jgi:hypothetical protein
MTKISNLYSLSNFLTVNSNGNIGIGRTSPEFSFDVNGDIALNRTNKLMFAGPVANDRSRSYITGDGNNNIFIYGPSNNLITTFNYTGTTTFADTLTISKSTPGASTSLIVENPASTGTYATASVWLRAYDGSAVTTGGSFFQTASTFSYQQISANQTNIYGGKAGGLRITAGVAPIIFANGSSDLDFSVARMTISSGGHVGIRTIPSNGWGTAMAALQIGTGGVLSNWTGGANNFTIGVNNYDNGAGSQLRLNSGAVSNVGFNDDIITFSRSASASAGTSIAWSESMRITGNGSVLIGTTIRSYSESFIVKGSSSSMGVVRFENNVNQGDVNHGTLMVVNTASYAIGNDASIAFALQNASNSFTDPRASIGCKTSSNLGGDLVFNTRNDAGYTEKVRITKDGLMKFDPTYAIGIRFANGSSNLNYYEEGSWTPTLAGTSGGSYTPTGVNSGRYVRIGNQVTVSGTLNWSGGTPFAGNLAIYGLPFASSGVRAAGSIGAVSSGLNFTSGYGQWVLVNDPTTSYIYIIQISTTGSGYSHQPSVSSSGIVYGFTLTYFIV